MARHVHQLIIGATAALLCSACILFTPRFSVVAWSPSEARIADPSGARVWLSFSGKADKSSVEGAFSLTKDGGAVNGKFAWDGDTLYFAPAEAMERNHSYVIELSTNAEDDAGVSLDEEFHFAFSTKAEEDRPIIVSLTPADGSTLEDRYAKIVMTFSESVDRESLYSAFSLSPSVKGRFDWSSDEKACSFVPLEPFAWQTEYSISIQNILADLSGNTIVKAHKGRFTIGTDKVAPTVLRVVNAIGGIEGDAAITPSYASAAASAFTGGWESTWGLVIAFSESVERDGLESRIRIEPAWTYTVEDAAALGTTFVLKPQERLSRDTLYSLTIAKGIKDAQGNASPDESVFKFMVDGTATASPKVTRLRFRSNPEAPVAAALYDDKPCDHSADYSSLSIAVPSFGVGSAIETYADVYFSLATGASIDLFSLMDEFAIEATNSCAGFSIKKIQTIAFADPQPLAVLGSSPVRVIMDITNTSASGIVTFKVGDGLVDSADNPIASAFRLPLLK
jgi:hypothetical protein